MHPDLLPEEIERVADAVRVAVSAYRAPKGTERRKPSDSIQGVP